MKYFIKVRSSAFRRSVDRQAVSMPAGRLKAELRTLFLLIILLLPISCASLPKIQNQAFSVKAETCNIPYVSGKWQFIHSIEAAMPGGKKGTMIGVTVISTETGTIHSAIMTIEGLVLFEAQYDQTLVINRGVPPFDSPAFAKGQMNDIKLIFFKPDGELTESGILESGSYVCRYKNDNGMTADVITGQDNSWEINQYRNSGLKRRIRAFFDKETVSINQERIPSRIELAAYGLARYSLKLELIEAELLSE